MNKYEPTYSKKKRLTRERAVRASSLALPRAGFGIGAVLYLLGLIGVGAGILFSSYSQSLKNNINMTNSVTVKNDLDAAATTLAATSVLGETDPSVLCPPQGGGASTNCTADPNLPTKMVEFYPSVNVTTSDPHLPSSYASASTGGSPVEAGVFTAGAGVKQVDPWGHYYIYCRWESAANSTTNPAFEILSAGPDGVLQTKCGATSPSGDDQIIAMNAANAVNRSAVWQTGTTGGNPDVYYGTTGHQLTVDAMGNVTVPGNITVDGSYSSPGTLSSGALTATSGTFTGDVTTSTALSAEGAAFSVGSGGTISATNGNFAVNAGGAISAAGGLFAVASTGDLAIGTSAFTVTAATGNTSIAGTLGVIGTVTLGTSGSYATPSLITYGAVNIGTTLLAAGTSKPYLSVGKGTGTPTTYPFYVDQYGSVVASSVTAGTFNGSLVGGTVNATNITDTGALSAAGITDSGTLSAGATTITGNTGITGNLTVSGTINGTLNVGGGGGTTITGVLPVANGGTGASTTATALASLGVTSGGYLSTALLTTGLIPGADLVGGSVTSTQLNSIVSAGTYDTVTVGADGRVTSGTYVPIQTNQINDGTGDTVTVGTTGIVFDLNSIQQGIWTSTGLGIGTTTPGAKLDVNGNVIIENAAGQTTPNQLQLMTGATSERWAITTDGVTESGTSTGSDFALKSYNNSGVAIGTQMILTRVGNATFTGSVSATNFIGSGAGLTGIGTGSITGTLGEANGGTGSTSFTQGSVVFAGATTLTQDNAQFFWDDTHHRLGIGTATPASSIQAYNGEVQVGSSGTSCSSTVAGALRYSSGSAYVCDGSHWDVIGGSSGAGGLMLGTSATAPNPYASATDLETGLYTAGAGAVDVTSAGTQIAEFNAGGLNVVTGKVGIGSASPVATLHVFGPATANVQTAAMFQGGVNNQFVSTNGGSGVGIQFVSPTTNSGVSPVWYGAQINSVATGVGTNFAQALAFYTNSGATLTASSMTEKMRIMSNGSVGIGTTSPAAADIVQATAASGDTVVAVVDVLGNKAYYRANSTNGSIRETFGTDNVGGFMFMETSNPFYIHSGADFYIQTPGAPNSGEAMRVLGSNGFVGIATNSPQSRLQVYQGEVQVGSSGTSCTAANAGALRYSGGSVYACDTTLNWDLIGGASGGTLPALANGDVWVGNGSNVATAVALSQDVTITNAGVATVGKIQNVAVGSPTGTAASAVVLAASPTLTGTVSAANITLSGYDTNTFGSDYTTSSPVTQSDVNLGTSSSVRFNGANAVTFEGIVAGAGGQELRLHNPSAYILTLADQSDSTDGTAANKIVTGTGADLKIPGNTSVTMQYDAASARWRVTGSSNSANTLAAGSTGQVQFNGGTNLAANANFFWDNTNSRLGIGTSAAPLSKLDIYGGIAVGTSYAGVTAAPTNGMIVQGNVGIGTTGPGAALEVNGGIESDVGGFFKGQLVNLTGTGTIVDAPGGSYARVQGFNFGSSTAVNLVLNPGGGNVGIGTTTPVAQLHLAGGKSAPAWGGSGVGIRQDAAAYTDTTSSGAVGGYTAIDALAAPTMAASSTVIYNNAATLAIAPPVAGTNVTLLNPLSLYALGNTRFAGLNAFGTNGPGSSPVAIIQIESNVSAAAWTTNGVALREDNATYTDTSSSGTVSATNINHIGQPSIAATTATTYTQADTFQIAAAPAAGTNVTITNALALDVASGASYFGGYVGIGTISPIVSLDMSQRPDALALPGLATGSTGRPTGGALANGEIRYNSVTPGIEAYVSGSWVTLQSASGTWTGATITVPYGGTGDTTLTAHGVMLGEGVSNVAVTAAGAVGTVLIGQGASADPIFSASPSVTNLTLSGYDTNTFGSDYTTSTATQSDVNLGTSSSVRFNGANAVTFEGIVAGAGGQELRLHNPSIYTLTLADQIDSTDGTAANKIVTGTGADLKIPGNTSVTMQYDAASARWRVTGSSNAAKSLAAGSDTQIQYNNQGNMAGSSGLVYNYTSGYVGIGTASPLASLSIGSGSVTNSAVPVQISTGGSGTQIFYGANVNGSYGANFGYVNGLSGLTGGFIREADSNPFYIQVNNTATIAMTFLSNGNVGIGTTTPGMPLQIGTSLWATSDFIGWNTPQQAEINNLYTNTAASTYAAAAILAQSAVSSNSASADIGLLIDNEVPASQTFNTGTKTGLIVAVDNLGTGTAGNMTGGTFEPFYGGSQTVANNYGVRIFSENTSTGTVTNEYGVQSEVENTSTGTVGAMYGLYSKCLNTTSGGTVTNCYELYLDTPTTTAAIGNKYGVYQTDSGSNNYFAGSVGIGTVTPNSLLQAYNGEVQVGSSGVACSSTNAGALRYSGGSAYVCDGAKWDVFGGSSGGGGLMLGTSATVPNPYASATDTQTGFYTAGAGKVDVTSAGTQIAEFNSGGLNVVTGKVGIGTTGPGTSLEVISSNINGVWFQSPNSSVANGNANLFIGTTDTEAADVGGSLAFVGNTVTTGSPVPFGYIWGRKENGTSANELGYLAFGTRTAGTANERMRITSGGNVGIGTTAPANLLTVISGASAGVAIYGEDDTGASIGVEGVTASTTAGAQGVYGAATASSGAATYGVYGYSNGGGGGAGVYGTSSVGAGVSGSGGSYGVYAAGTSGGYGIYSATGPNYFSGQVSIGTTARANKLDVNGAAAFGSYAGTATAPSGGMILSGNVGIGTTSPAATLNPETNANGDTLIAENAFGSFTNDLVRFDMTGEGDNSGYSLFRVYNTSGPGFIVTGNRTVGIGTGAPLSQLELYGSTGQTTAALTDAGSRTNILSLNTNNSTAGAGSSITFGNNQSLAAGSIGFAAIKGLLGNGSVNTSGDIAFSTRNAVSDTALTERMRIAGDGYVGIGSPSPIVSLDLSQKTDALALPVGMTANRPTGVNLTAGEIRYNQQIPAVEVYISGAWNSILTGGGGLLGTSVTAANPQISGDPTSGFYTAGAAKVDVTISGVQIAEWNSGGFNVVSGRVGIGTTSPTAGYIGTLDVRGGIMTATTDYVDTTTGSSLTFGLGATTGNTYSRIQAYTSGRGGTGSLALNALGGSVGIGTTSPQRALEVYSSSFGYAGLFEGTLGGGTGLVALGGSASGGVHGEVDAFTNDGLGTVAPLALQGGGGNVGIGTAVPGEKLDVTGNGASWTTIPGIRISDTSGNANSRNWAIYTNANAYGDLQFFVSAADAGSPNNATPVMTMLSGGNVGIGTTAPLDKVTINGAGAGTVGLGVNFDSTNYPNLRGIMRHAGDCSGSGCGLEILAQGASHSTNGSGDINFFVTGTNSANTSTDASYTDAMTIRYNGNVGIGTTTPGAQLESYVVGSNSIAAYGYGYGSSATGVYGQGFGSGSIGVYATASGSTAFGVYSAAGTNYFAGNVGIGVTGPGSPLTVVGTSGSLGSVAMFAGTGTNQVNITGNSGAWGMLLGSDPSGTATSGYHGSLASYLINVQNGPLSLGINNGVQMTIATSGNVGIGSTSPTARFSVTSNANGSGSLQTTAALRADDGTSDTAVLIGADNTTHQGYIQSMQPNVSWGNRPLVLNPNGGNVVMGQGSYVFPGCDGTCAANPQQSYYIYSDSTYGLMTNTNWYAGNYYIAGAGWLWNQLLNQSVMTTAAPTFAALTINGQLAATNPATGGIAVYGSASGNGIGVYGVTANSGNFAVYGANSANGCNGWLAQNGYSAGGNCGTSFASDARLKHDIMSVDDGLNTIMKLKPVTYLWKRDSKNHALVTDAGEKARNYGFIAQDVEQVLPALVTHEALGAGKTEGVEEPKDGFLSLDYNGLIAPIVKAVQELYGKWSADHDILVKIKADNDNFRTDEEKQLAVLKADSDKQLATLRADNDNLRQELEALKAQLVAGHGSHQ